MKDKVNDVSLVAVLSDRLTVVCPDSLQFQLVELVVPELLIVVVQLN